MQAGVGLLILDVMPIYRSLPGYRHDYLKFYQLPNSKKISTVCYFIWEKPLVNPTAPGVLFPSYCFWSCFPLLLFRTFQIWTIFYFASKTHLRLIFHLTVKGLTTPWSRWVWRFVFLCAGADYVVLQGPPSGSITLVLNWGKYFTACYIILSASRTTTRNTLLSSSSSGSLPEEPVQPEGRTYAEPTRVPL